MHGLRHAGTLAPDQQNVAGAKGEIEVFGRRLGGQQHEPPALGPPPLLERGEGHVAHQRRLVEIIEPGAPEAALGRIECQPAR